MACDINALLEEAKCFIGVDRGLIKAVQAQLLCDISTAAGAGLVLNGHGAPVDAPGSTAAIYTDIDTSTLYQWNGSAWV